MNDQLAVQLARGYQHSQNLIEQYLLHRVLSITITAELRFDREA